MLLPIAIFSMITALTMYTVGVWGEKLTGILKSRHLSFFWIGFIFDTLGTTVMGRIAGVFTFNLHGITGAAAIVLMLAHAIWASLALGFPKEQVLRGFHRYSLAVWGIWLVPFASGMLLAMIH
jgi:uncharacterized repeat protein (TIGR03987 family)